MQIVKAYNNEAIFIITSLNIASTDDLLTENALVIYRNTPFGQSRKLTAIERGRHKVLLTEAIEHLLKHAQLP